MSAKAMCKPSSSVQDRLNQLVDDLRAAGFLAGLEVIPVTMPAPVGFERLRVTVFGTAERVRPLREGLVTALAGAAR